MEKSARIATVLLHLKVKFLWHWSVWNQELIFLSLTDLQGSSDLIWRLALTAMVLRDDASPPLSLTLHPAKTQYLVLIGWV